MITKAKADELVQKYPNFYKKEVTINDTKVYLFNYILSDYQTFQEEPLSRELRGLVITEDNEVFLSVPKFFNLNEIPETQYNLLKNVKIKKIQEKLDGSLITPIVINGDVIMKSKGSFASDQSKLAQEIVEDSADLKFFILDMASNNFQPFFELTGEENQHVLEYDYKQKLTLIMVRNQDGEFIDINKFNYKYTAESYDHTLEEMQNMQTSKKGIEGWVVKFNDGQIIKIKTQEYFELHKLNDSADSYKTMLSTILNEDMDDVLSIVSPKKKEKLLQMNKDLSDYVVSFVLEIENIIKDSKKLDRKTVALKYKNHMYFNVIMKSFVSGDVKGNLIFALKSKYHKEQKAKDFLISIEK